MLLPTENYLQRQKWSPYRGIGVVLLPFVLNKKRKMDQPVPTKVFLQPAKTATIGMACHDYACPTHFHYPSTFFANAKLQNELRQLITCGQSCMTSTSSAVIRLTNTQCTDSQCSCALQSNYRLVGRWGIRSKPPSDLQKNFYTLL